MLLQICELQLQALDARCLHIHDLLVGMLLLLHRQEPAVELLRDSNLLVLFLLEVVNLTDASAQLL